MVLCCSYQSLLCLQHEAAHIALASIFVALQLLRLDPGLRNGWHWWEEIVGASLPAEVLIGVPASAREPVTVALPEVAWRAET